MTYCTIHEVQMESRQSKTKFDANGAPKTYFAHTGPDGKLCFGQPAVRPQQAMATSPKTTPETFDNRSYRIERQHSQEMAIRALALYGNLDLEEAALKDLIKKWTDYFHQDLEKSL